MHKLNWSRAQFSSPNPCITSCVIQTLIQIHSQACRASAFCFTHPWKLIFLLAQCLPCRFHSQHTQAFSPLWSSACALSSPLLLLPWLFALCPASFIQISAQTPSSLTCSTKEDLTLRLCIPSLLSVPWHLALSDNSLLCVCSPLLLLELILQESRGFNLFYVLPIIPVTRTNLETLSASLRSW